MGRRHLFGASLCLSVLACKPQTKAHIISSTNTVEKLIVEEVSSDQVAVSLEAQALTILETQCASCHNFNNAQGGFGSILDVEEMIKSGKYIVPGNPAESTIFNRLAPEGNMPPSGEFADEDRQVLEKWITEITIEEVIPLSTEDEIKTIRADLEQNVAAGNRSFVRYFSLQNQNNAGLSSEQRDSMLKALAKTLNSLSSTTTVKAPLVLDEQKNIVRIDLRDYGFDVASFEAIINEFYPFAISQVPFGNDPVQATIAENHSFLAQEIGSTNFRIRMDWFVATATLPELYKRFLGLPPTLQELDVQLGVDAISNITNNLVIRSGFRNSGVSSQNRIIERHVSSNNLPYWISYDFADNNEGQQNIFNFPLGPVGAGFDEKAFDHDGGEVIFQLPNGLFGYYLNLADGTAIDKGPTNIVRQINGPSQFFQAIVNGMSCMSCHGQGLLPKKDDIRGFAAAAQNFSQAEKVKIADLFVPETVMNQAIAEDNQRYFESLKGLGISPLEPDPINNAYQHYNKALFKKDVQAELGFDDNTFNTMIQTEPFRTAWVSIFYNSGSITRQEFNLLYGEAIRAFGNGREWTEPTSGDHLITPDCMVADPASMSTCTFSLLPEPPVVEDPAAADQAAAAGDGA